MCIHTCKPFSDIDMLLVCHVVSLIFEMARHYFLMRQYLILYVAVGFLVILDSSLIQVLSQSRRHITIDLDVHASLLMIQVKTLYHI